MVFIRVFDTQAVAPFSPSIWTPLRSNFRWRLWLGLARLSCSLPSTSFATACPRGSASLSYFPSPPFFTSSWEVGGRSCLTCPSSYRFLGANQWCPRHFPPRLSSAWGCLWCCSRRVLPAWAPPSNLRSRCAVRIILIIPTRDLLGMWDGGWVFKEMGYSVPLLTLLIGVWAGQDYWISAGAQIDQRFSGFRNWRNFFCGNWQW